MFSQTHLPNLRGVQTGIDFTGPKTAFIVGTVASAASFLYVKGEQGAHARASLWMFF